MVNTIRVLIRPKSGFSSRCVDREVEGNNQKVRVPFMVVPIPKKTPLESGFNLDPNRVLIESEFGSHLDPNRVRNVCVHFANSRYSVISLAS